jgi:SdrD B-like domain
MEPRLPCQAYWEANVVFAGTVTQITASENKDTFHRRLIRFSVTDPFRGLTGSEAEVLTGSGDADCGYGFQLGGDYLVYAHLNKEDNKLYTSICSRTRPLSSAADDLKFIRGLTKAEPGALISGWVKQLHRKASHDDGPKPISNVKVMIVGPAKRVELLTDSEGQYKISGLTAGKYKVEVKPPNGLSIYKNDQNIEVFDRGCAHVDFILEADTRVSGKLLDAEGQPVPDVLIELVPTKVTPQSYPSFLRSDKDGRYEFKLLQAGTYFLGVRIFGSAGATYTPFPRTYYPGVNEESQATVINVSESDLIELGELILPPRLIERTLKGVVVDSQDRPVKGATVWLKERQYSDRDMPYRSETDAEGFFSFKVFEGFKYELNAYEERPGDKTKRSELLTVIIDKNPPRIKLILRAEEK